MPGSGKYSFECWKWIAGRDSLQRGKPGGEAEEGEGEEGEEVGWVGGGDESCGTIFHSRQKHLLGYQFGAEKQSSPPAPSSIIFLC